MHSVQFKSLFPVAAFLSFGLAVAPGQTQDNSQNALLKGTYQFRDLAIQNVDANDDPTEVTATYGTIAFDGAGNYTIAGTQVDNVMTNGVQQPFSATGTYAIGSNGGGYITNPNYPGDVNALIYGFAAQGVFTGSATESEGDGNIYNDIFVAIPVGTPPTNASYTSSYQTGLLDFPGGTASGTRNALFELVPNGKGSFGTITLSGQNAAGAGFPITQTITGATYNFNADGSATLTIPAPSGRSTNVLFSGSKTMYESADGNFILGWTATGYDIFFGVKALAVTGTNTLSTGLYFTAALEDFPVAFGGQGSDSYYGGTNNTGDSAGDGIAHQRVNTPSGPSFDYGSDDQIVLNSDGTTGPNTDYLGYQYIFGDGGQAFVAIGSSGYFSLVIGMHAASFAGTGVYLNPIGVTNAASFAPVTASIAPGELLQLTGTGLASSPVITQGGQVFPTTLGGVTVSIDGIACPIYYVSSTQLAVIVPYEVASNQTGLANIQVTNNKVASNVVQVYLTDAQPGSFSQMQNGIDLAAARHALTGQEITDANPVQPGEYISLYLTGLGTVTPTIMDGALGPSTPLSWSDLYESGYLSVYFNDYNAGSFNNAGVIQFAGLTPTLGGLYQINVQVPAGVLTSGDNVYVTFATDAAVVNQIQIPYGAGAPALDRTSRPVAAALPARASRIAAIRSRRNQAMPPRATRAPATNPVSQ